MKGLSTVPHVSLLLEPDPGQIGELSPEQTLLLHPNCCFGPPSAQSAPVNNHSCVVLWYLCRKEVCEHPISTQQNQHDLSQWIILTLRASVSHAGLLQHPIYIFIGQLSPPLGGVSGSRPFSNGGISAIL